MFNFNDRIWILSLAIILFLNLSGCSGKLPEMPTRVASIASLTTTPITAGSSTPAAFIKPEMETVEPEITIIPDARLELAYEKSGNLWALYQGAISQITATGKDSRPRISSDGKLITFQRGAELWVVDVSSQIERKLFEEDGALPLHFEFATGTHKVFFTTSGLDGKPRFDLNVSDADEGGTKNLLQPGKGGEFTPVPGWGVLALVQTGKILTFNPDNGQARLVYQFDLLLNDTFLPPINWLENGYGFITIIPGQSGKPTRLMFIPANGEKPAQLAEFLAVSTSVSDFYISPDGSKVLYLKDHSENLELHVIDVSTADKTYIQKARGKIGVLGWTPDSENMIFWLDDPMHIWISNGETSSPLSDKLISGNIIWVDAKTCLYLVNSELSLQKLGQKSQIIDKGVSNGFDAIILPDGL